MKRFIIPLIFLFVANTTAGVKFSKHLLTNREAPRKMLTHALSQTSRISPDRIVALEQIVQGYTYASLSSLAGLAGGILITEITGGDGYDGLAAMALGGLAGYVVGGAYGVYIYGKDRGGQGSFWITLLGSAVGGLFYLLPAPVGAYFAYDWSNKDMPSASPSSGRRYKQPLNIVINF